MSKIQLSEKDIEYLFGGKKSSKKALIKDIISYFLVFLAVFAFSYGIINYLALKSIVSYWYSNEIALQNDNNSEYSPSIISSNSATYTIGQKSSLPSIDDNHILIPKINANAPISWQVADNEQEIQSNLEKGVVQLAGTSLPGQTGNIFITGHSSNYFWAKGNYKNIFVLLNKLVVGDLIYIKYQGNIYTYRVENLKIVKPTDTSVLQNSQDSILTLMTCSPVGTSINRLIVTSIQIDPNPTTNSNENSGKSNKALPSGVR